MLNKIMFVTASKGKVKDSIIQRSFDRFNGFPFEVDAVNNNKTGLGELYYEKCFQYKHYKDVSHLVFVHDDVLIQDMFFYETIMQHSKQFDVMGIAGSSAIRIDNWGKSHVSWFNRSNTMHGAVTHPVCDKTEGLQVTTNYGVTPHSCLAVDGLMLIIKREVIESGINFDKLFNWHFYDLDFCFSVIEKGYNIGVVPIPVMHLSQGAGISTSDYSKTEQMFLTKWNPNRLKNIKMKGNSDVS